MSIKIEKAISQDFDEFVHLLKDLNPRISENTWEKLVSSKWSDEDYIGYKAADNGKIIGIILTIFSRRLYNSVVIKFCNISSIVIEKAYRKQGIAKLLLQELNELRQNYIITGFNPVDFTINSYISIGFNYFENSGTVVRNNFLKYVLYGPEKIESSKPLQIPHISSYMTDPDLEGLKSLSIKHDDLPVFCLFENRKYFSAPQKIINKVLKRLKINFRLSSAVFFPHFISSNIKSKEEYMSISMAVYKEYGINKLILPSYIFSGSQSKKVTVDFSLLVYKPEVYKNIPADTLCSEYFYLNN